MSRLAVGPSRQIDAEIRANLEFWPTYLAHAMPRTLRLNDARRPVIMYVDGAEEDSGVAVGAVVFDPDPVTGIK
eukprot:16445038-Heterocapsa_arctica.AAC.1